ncbi:hypothetical protein K470DRAFT_178200 [Piedraia hortae CBS 480.64]|uniref:Uncharacterized protein n=1 Tax=Piedraia hortae CBS 480.64 TaxID=1314780 RepID=A0A6A7BRJ2_9PEZI|nr:hypothetical protein K470DRAFT_178200 [Piedraia hortae CBS 480.64]
MTAKQKECQLWNKVIAKGEAIWYSHITMPVLFGCCNLCSQMVYRFSASLYSSSASLSSSNRASPFPILPGLHNGRRSSLCCICLFQFIGPL